MDQRRSVKDDFESTSEGRRKMGRPSMRRLEDVEEGSAGDEDGGRGDRMGYCS